MPAIVEIRDTTVLFTDGLTIQLQLLVKSFHYQLVVTEVLSQIPEMCSPVNLTVILEEDDTSTSVSCPVAAISGPTATVTVTECGVRENEKYSVTMRAENEFKLSSSSEPITICE